MVQVWQVAKENGVTSNAVIDACALLGIPATRVASKLNARQVQRLNTYFAGRRPSTRGRTTPVPPPVRSADARERPRPPILAIKPRYAAMWDVMEVAEIPEIPNGCACCGMRFERSADDPRQRHCHPCRSHFPNDGEPAERELARLRDHDRRLRPGFVAAWHQQGQYEGRMKSAMQSRDKWKAALAEVLLAHEEAEDGSCKVCHETSWPCSTWRKLEEANRGIFRKVEGLWGLDDEELKRVLYGEDEEDV